MDFRKITVILCALFLSGCSLHVGKDASNVSTDTGKQAEEFVEAGKHTEDPVEAGKHTERPVETGKHTEGPVEAGKHTEGPVEAGKHTENPVEAGKRTEGAVEVEGSLDASEHEGGFGDAGKNPEGSQSVKEGQLENSGTNEQVKGNSPLVIACGRLSGNFSAFFPETTADRQLAELTSVYLLEKDRAGAVVTKGRSTETRVYEGREYCYEGIADCVVEDQGEGAKYTFTLREDVRFSDGEPLTASDLVFSMYVYLDPSYDGPVQLHELPIRGLEEYQGEAEPLYRILLQRGKENENFDLYSEKVQVKFFEVDWPKARRKLIQSIMKHFGTDSVAEAMIALGYANLDETGRVNSVYTYQHWSMEGDDQPDMEDFLEELVWNADIENVSEQLKDGGIVKKGIDQLLPAKYRKLLQVGKEAKSIAGIRSEGSYQVTVELSRKTSDALDKLSVPIQPLHYYGNIDKFNIKKHKYGFNKGDLTSIRDKSGQPLGAGPYVFVKYKKGKADLAANSYYYKGKPVTNSMQMRAVSENEMAYEILAGNVDIAEPSITRSDLMQLRRVNRNGKETGERIATVLWDYPAYGYIGLNAGNVCVAARPESEQSVALRKALAVVLAYERFASVHEYYGDTAELIEYPMGKDSWASPGVLDENYEKAYRRKVDGSLIYTTRMTQEERENAVREAALEYFEKAGYVVKNGKLKKAPEGASLTYTVMVTGYGKADHPSYQILKDSKELLSAIGLKLIIRDYMDSSEMFEECRKGNAQLWCAAWPTDTDPESYLFSLFHSHGGSSYLFRIQSSQLDEMLEKTSNLTEQSERKEMYRQCLNEIRELAVEVPVYQRQNCMLYSPGRIGGYSMPENQTSHYSWRDEVEKIRKY